MMTAFAESVAGGALPSEPEQLVALVVDRDANTRGEVKAVLSEAGFVVESASSAEAAMSVLFELRPDVIVTDVRLGRCDGLAFCREVKAAAELSSTAVLIYTFFLSAESDARRAGADGFLLKPADGAELVATVRNMVMGEG